VGGPRGVWAVTNHINSMHFSGRQLPAVNTPSVSLGVIPTSLTMLLVVMVLSSTSTFFYFYCCEFPIILRSFGTNNGSVQVLVNIQHRGQPPLSWAAWSFHCMWQFGDRSFLHCVVAIWDLSSLHCTMRGRGCSLKTTAKIRHV
jgi:hypothetical protein